MIIDLPDLAFVDFQKLVDLSGPELLISPAL